MKIKSLKAKLIIVVIACLSAATAINAWLLINAFQQNINTVSREALRSAKDTYVNLEEDSTRVLSSTLVALLDNDGIKARYMEKDRNKLYQLAAPTFSVLKSKFNITHWYFINPENGSEDVAQKCFLRVHKPEQYGDVIKRFTYLNAVKDKTFSVGKELGLTAFALRVVHPYYKNNKLIGYMELGQEIDNFISIMKKQTGDDYALLIEKKYLNEASWASVRTSHGLPNNWNAMKEMLVVDNTTDSESILQFDGSIEQIPDEGKTLERVSQGSSVYIRSIFPIYDAGNRKVGGIFVLHNVTAMYNNMNSTLHRVIALSVTLMLVLTFLLIFFLDRLIIKRLNVIINTATNVVGGDFNAEIVRSSDDEIGRFEELFEQFRKILVDMVKNVEEKGK
ncbi:MAG: hypothetical protein A2339_00360 [Elusimicrobia bacterium RIFOXYB12_FULL_50_12]|nr:MAG: hypothetical protein A2278_05950 [Elusimicrobia bacterium RIFOXYA12_FULL_49_49]OGS11320.1 MAG: hypothetical protein A2386_08370 [Elusimicrobia bacterium RIFOXYB1_FULL_48_9]OGS16663.1 MAG: hypothetical protein A2251_04785 [Elusimicrobia bacterium RIFOXYA2_FULL_47_53]OGS25512.1 MAG: hypothetical protein A2339_00360 [Elusimicrobia bacterium RIFOXYB12_FULL_50_12]OGS31641.1 MAG: hypothetical protein A2323_03505 [Elusimicrobia bacterium RIFOXYB2_FULL_46_23]